MKNYKFKIIGKVQGVYYRVNIKNNAFSSGFSGYVKNLTDGSVEVGVTCEESRLENFLEILKQGSKYSSVTDITYKKCDELFSGDFEIR